MCAVPFSDVSLNDMQINGFETVPCAGAPQRLIGKKYTKGQFIICVIMHLKEITSAT